MNNMLSTKTNALFFAVMLFTGTIGASSSSFITTAVAQTEQYYKTDEYTKYGMDMVNDNVDEYKSPSYSNDYNHNSYDQKYGNDNNYYKSEYPIAYETKQNVYEPTDSNVLNQKFKCENINFNININGIDSNQVPSSLLANDLVGQGQQQLQEDQNNNEEGLNGIPTQEGNNDIDFDKNIVNICKIDNDNDNNNLNKPELEPESSSLTVNKEIYGCDNVSGRDQTFGQIMNCQNLQNDSPAWISCDDPTISDTRACQLLPGDYFDINVLDDQNNQRAQFQGSAEGTTIENLEPGTYTINEIEYTGNLNQLGEDPVIDQLCRTAGFSDGGSIANRINFISYDICFEYEDEQGNDCRNISLTVGGERTCTVKNYILLGEDDD
jgi:hypothetical protein